MAISLNRALLGAVAAAILAGLIPAAVVLDRRLVTALEDRARDDLALAPRVLADRVAANATTLMMFAKDLADAPGLSSAVESGDRAAALETIGTASASLPGAPVLIGPAGESWMGATVDSALVAETRAGRMPVVTRRLSGGVANVALAPIESDGRWIGAAGLTVPLDAATAGTLSGLTRASVVLIADGGGAVASTVDSSMTAALAAAVGRDLVGGAPRELRVAGQRVIAVSAGLDGAATAVFVRRLEEELALLPELRRVAALSAGAALLVALVLGTMLAARLARPVHELAGAATAFAGGDLAAPLPSSEIREVRQVATTFDAMRRSLAARLAELREANAALTDRNARLSALQADLMQRDRLAATGRLVAQLAHEIRNPVASLRNCLELIRRRVEDDAEAREFADLALDELLRMHEMAEQMLDLARPRDPGLQRCRPVAVAREVARLATMRGVDADGRETRPALAVAIAGDDATEAAISPDALKQILLNLLQNASDAAPAGTAPRVGVAVGSSGSEVTIDVRDDGAGIPEELRPRVFDPFFTTKAAVHGVGLGLFVAEGLVRSAGGSIAVAAEPLTPPRALGGYGGAWFHIELPAAPDPAPDGAAGMSPRRIAEPAPRAS